MKDIQQTKEYMSAIRERSGNITIDCKLTSFIYTLLRDYVQPGDIEEIMLNHISDEPVEYCNGWLATYANDISSRLKSTNSTYKMDMKELYKLQDEEYPKMKQERIDSQDNKRVL